MGEVKNSEIINRRFATDKSSQCHHKKDKTG